MTIIAPSVLSLDFSNVAKNIEMINQSQATWIHYDVMDGHFVPNITFGPDILNTIEKYTDRFIDVHLMVNDPKQFVSYFSKCKVDNCTFHYEAVNKDDINNVIETIKKQNWKVGISIKPDTDVSVLKPYLDMVDLVLVMSVNPGFGNQKFIDSAISKIAWLNDYRKNNNFNYLIQVDGGINDETYKECVNNGCDVLVSGSYLFKHPLGLIKGVETLL